VILPVISKFRQVPRIEVLKELNDEKFTLDGREFPTFVTRSATMFWRTFRLQRDFYIL